MATRNDKVKHKRSLEVKETKTWTKVKFILNGSSSQSSDATTSTGVMKKCNYNDVEKEKGNSEVSKLISAVHQVDDKSLPNKLPGNKKEREGEVVQNCALLASQTEMRHCVSNEGGSVEATSTSEQSKSIIQEKGDSFKGRAAKLKRKTKRLRNKLRKYAALCMELNAENKLILDELKKVCQAGVVQMLEAKNPYKNSEMELSKLISHK